MNVAARAILMSSVSIAILGASAANAQERPAPGAETAASEAPNEQDIIVTANKREERVLDVAGAVTALRGDDLLASGMTSIADFAGITPGLQFNKALGSGAPIIRGLSEGVDTSPTVASVVNGAPIGSSSSLGVGAQDTLDLDPIDIQRVEILKGPQGTLYGASTLGGLISYIVREPSLAKTDVLVRGELAATEQGDPSYSMRAALSSPLVTDNAAIGVSGYYDRRGGFIDNDVRGIEDQNRATSWGVRGTLLAKPSERLKISLNGFYQKVDNKAGDFVLYGLASGAPLTGDLKYDGFTLPSSNKHIAAGVLNVDYELDFATLSSVTSIQHMKSDNRQNVTNSATNTILAFVLPAFGGVPFPGQAVSELNNLFVYDKHTQEVRLTSTGDGPFSWIVGGFYSHEKDRYDAIFRGRTTTGEAIAALDPALAVTLLPSLTEYSGFVNATYEIGPRFEVTGGFRIGKIEQRNSQLLGGSDAAAYQLLLLVSNGTSVPAVSAVTKSSETVKTYLATARYHLSDDSMIFARFATGFRAGGPNITGPGLPTQFNPDRTVNYEGGLKTRILGGRGSVDITGYYTKWKDIILLFSPGGINGYTNGGDARVYGVEAAVNLRPVDGLSLTGTYAYSKGNLTRVEPVVASSFSPGDQLPYSPRHSGSISAEYSTPIGGDWTGYASATARFAGSRFSAFAANPQIYKMPAYGLVDLHAGIENDHYTIDLFVKNLTDKRAQLAANNFDIPEVAIQRPRTFGIAFTGKF